MNKQRLKETLQQLADEGRFPVRVDDEYVDGLLRHGGNQPSEEVTRRFLANFRVRIQDAAIERRLENGGLAMKRDNQFGSKRSKG
jgi:hypothetical protein